METQTQEDKQQWYTVVSFSGGVAACPPIPSGPWPSLSQAESALEQWRTVAGDLARTHANRVKARLVGPYSSIHKAREAGVTSRRLVREL